MPLGGIQQLRGQEGGEGGSAKSPRLSTQGGGGGYQDVHVDKTLQKGKEESWQMTMKILITSPFVQLWLENAVHRRWILFAKSSVIGDKVAIKLHYIEYFIGGGAFLAPFVHVDRGGYVECPRLSTRGGEGVKIGSKLVHVVVECPLWYSNYPVSHTYECCISINILLLIQYYRVRTKQDNIEYPWSGRNGKYCSIILHL